MRDSTLQNSFSPETAELNQVHEITQKILEAFKSFRFGTDEIIIHDAKVVQLERKEKTRFEATEIRKGR